MRGGEGTENDRRAVCGGLDSRRSAVKGMKEKKARVPCQKKVLDAKWAGKLEEWA